MRKHQTLPFHRMMALLLCCVMVLSMLPVSALAENAAAVSDIVVSQTITLPGYPGGSSAKVSKVMEYDCGNAVTGNGDKSYLTIVTGTPSSEFLAYRDTLAAAGYTLTMENEVASDTAGDPNRFASYLSPDGSYKVYIYHFPFYQETRIIVDTEANNVSGFNYVSKTGESAEVMLTMYGLSMSENGYDNTTTTEHSTDKRNCGALIVIRMPDNSLFIHDGGDLEQWSDEANRRFMEFCRELTGKKEGEKVVINTWFISHAHTDHYLGLPRFFSQYHDQLDLKYIMYNIDIERTYTTRDIRKVVSMVSSYYPEVKYYKPHTGETLNIAGVDFDVIYSHEDRYVPNANGELITDYPEIVDGKTVSEYDIGGTYRDYAYATKGDATTKSDFNDTSVVLRVHLDENTDALLYADMNRADQTLFDIYPDSALETDIMMIPHHCFDSHPKLCELSKATIFLMTQHRGAIYGADGDLSTKDPDGQYRPRLYNNYMEMRSFIEAGERTYWAGNETVCITLDPGADVPADMTKDTQAPTGYTAYLADAYNFVYEGWTVDGSDDTTVEGDWQGDFSEVQTTNHTIRYDQVTNATLSEDQQYVIVHDASNNVLLHDAVAQKTTSQRAGTRDEVDAGTVLFFYAKNDTQKLYSPHYFRDQALWKLLNIYIPDPNNKNDANRPLNGNQTPKFGGEATYRYSNYTKGLNTDDSFWYTTAADTEATRVLQPNKENLALADPTSQNIYTEFFDDGTCVIFYYKSDGTSIAFITVDSNGNWVQKLYKNTDKDANVAAVKNDLPQLKLRLYSYYLAENDMQTLAYEGVQDYAVLTTVSKAETTSLISSGINVKDTSRRNMVVPCSGTTPKVGYYYLQFAENYKAGQIGDYMVKLQFRNDDGTDTQIGTVVVHIVEQIPIQGSRLDIAGTVSKNAGVGAIPQVINSKTGETSDCKIAITYNTAEGQVTREIPLSVGMLTDSNGNLVDTSVEGVYKDLTVTYQGVVLTGNFTLTVSAHNDVLNYPHYPEEGSVHVSKQGITTLGDFSKNGVANIQLSATGIPTSNGVDLIIVMDLSGSMRYGLDNTTRVDQQSFEATRLYAMEQSLTQMVEMLRASGADVRIAMSDFGDLDSHEFEGAIVDYSIRDQAFFDVDFSNAYRRDDDYTKNFYEFSNHLNFPMKSGDKEAVAYPVANSKFNISNPSYTGKVVPTIYTGSKEANAEAFVDVQDLNMAEIIEALNVDINKSNGTNYDVGLEYAYHLGMAIQQKNIDEGEDRDIVVIFMSDGAPMQYNYFSGRPHMTGWSDWITGNADGIYSLNYSETNKPEGMAELESALFALLKEGKLINPLYRRDNPDGGKGKFVFKLSVWNDVDPQYPYFYTYMDDLGYDLDWQYLVDIAKANGMENFDYATFLSNPMLPELTALLKDRNLVNPYYSIDQYYPKPTEDQIGEDFFATMNNMGYDIGWDQFAKIAYRNRNYNSDGTSVKGSDYGEIGTRLMNMLNNIRDIPAGEYATLSPYAYFYHEDGLNWWAEAIKGKSTELYPVINKYAYHNSTERPFGYYGDVRNNFSTGTGLPLDGKDYIGGFRGLDADIYSVSFSIANERELSAEDAELVMRRIATGPSYFFAANTQEGLTSALKAIASTVSSGASRAWYTDTMGPEFDLSTSKTVKNADGKTVTVNADPTIRVLEYTLYKPKSDAPEELAKIGTRVGDPNVREVVKFQSGPEGSNQVFNAWSDQVYTTSVDSSGKIQKNYTELLGADGIIRAKYFYYNTNKYVDASNTGAVRIDLTGDGVGDYNLPAETFLWIIGVLGETEMVLDYQVYLTGSIEGDREAGLYDTNTRAELQYINYLGNDCAQEVPTPKYPWDQGSVGYAFYLVDRNGNPIINQDTGATGSFELSVELTDIIYDTFNLDGTEHTLTAEELMQQLIESGKMSDDYTLFDPAAQYTVTVDNTAAPGEVNGTYSVVSGVKTPTTYVSGLEYDDILPTPGETHTVTNAATANTVVWFAVYADVQTYPDAVVIDYGIPVNIHVMGNDKQMPAKYAELVGIGAYREPGYTENLAEGFGSTYDGTYGTASIINTDASNAIIRYTLNVENGMQMSTAEKFTYAVKYSGSLREKGYYYETITVIPAANIYYEDSYLNFTDSANPTGGFGVWQDERTIIAVSCYNVSNWDEVYAYCKGDSGPAGVWPGVKMTDNDHDNVYTAYVSADQLGKTVMFNNGDQAYQTLDLTIAGDGAVYKIDGSWTVYSGAPSDTKTVYFENTWNWGSVNAYCWNDSGEMKGWSGTAMSYDTEKGQYYIEVPADMVNIIFNDGGSNQTGNLVIRDEYVYRPDGYSYGPKKTVYFKNESNWAEVHAYWWDSTANNTWPGPIMSYDDAKDLYYAEVPADMTNIIFNNGTGGDGNQTKNLAIGGNLVYKPDGTYTVLGANTTERTVYFNAEGCPWNEIYAYCWNYAGETQKPWPGTEMTLDQATGLYSVVVPADMTNIIFTNNRSGQGHNLGEVTIQKDGEVYREIRWEYSETVNDVYFDNSTSGWDEVYAYYWSFADTGMTSWPGEKMTRGENGLYHLALPVNAEYVVFNHGSSLKQTVDITLDVSGSIYYPDGTVKSNNTAGKTYYYRGASWDKVYAYYWHDEDKNMTGWTSNEMDYDAATGLHSITVPYNAKYIIFHNNGGQQTADLLLPATGSIYHGEAWNDYDGDPILQAEDRPGSATDALKNLDADNVYGYDSAYDNCTMYSLGSAMKVTVDATTGNYASRPVPKDKDGNTLDIWGYLLDEDGNRVIGEDGKPIKKTIAKYEQTVSGDHPTATFTFTGTGFDVVGLTDSTSGGLIVEVRQDSAEGKIVKDHVVNTYFGYQCVKNEETGEMEWVLIQNPTDEQRAELCLYQVPVMKIENLDYGTYHVTIRAVYMSSMDMDLGKDEDGNWLKNGSYTVWLDAIRIYNPAQEDDTSNGAYEQDGENNPHYITIKDLLVKADSFADGNAQNGIVYVDGKAEGVTIKDYENQGPNNETYLMHFSGIAFKLRYNGDSKPDVNIHLGAKLAKGSYATLNYNSALLVPSLSTATNMFYKLTPTWTKNAETGYWETVVILQSYGSDAITSLTDLKITGADAGSIVGNPAGDTEPALMIVVDDEVVEAAKLYMSADSNDDTSEGGNTTPEGGNNSGDKPEDETTKPTDKVEDETTKPTEKVEDETTKPTTKPSGSGNKPAQDGSNAATGDNMMVFVMLMMFSVMGMAAMTVLARKKEEM